MMHTASLYGIVCVRQYRCDVDYCFSYPPLFSTALPAAAVLSAGIVLNTAHFYPNDPTSEADKQAAQRGYGETLLLYALYCVYMSYYYLPTLSAGPLHVCLLTLSADPLPADFWYGWFLDPLTKGEYPASMRETCGARLPTFTADQLKVSSSSSISSLPTREYSPYP